MAPLERRAGAAGPRTTRTDVRRARPSPACRTPHNPHTTRWESPVGGGSPPSGARTPVDQAPPAGRCSTGSRSDEPVASAKRTARCGWPGRRMLHSRPRRPPPSSDDPAAPADGPRSQVRHDGPPRPVRAPPLSGRPHPRPFGQRGSSGLGSQSCHPATAHGWAGRLLGTRCACSATAPARGC